MSFFDSGDGKSTFDSNNASGESNEDNRGCISDTSSITGEGESVARTTDIRDNIVDLVRLVIPHEIDNVDDLLLHFDGREEKLRDTLQGMYERKIRIGSMDVDQANGDTQAEESKTSLLAQTKGITNAYINDKHEEYDPVTLSVGSSKNEPDEEIGLTGDNICVASLAHVQDVSAINITKVSEEKDKILDPTLPMRWWKKRRKLIYSCVAFTVLIALVAILGVHLVDCLHGDFRTNNDNEQSVAAPSPVSLEITTPSAMPLTTPISTLVSTKPTAATTTTNVTTTDTAITTPSLMPSTPPILNLISTKPSTPAKGANEAFPVAVSTPTPTLFPTRFSTSSPTATISVNNAYPPVIPTTTPSESCYHVQITILYDAFPFGTGYAIAEATTVSTSFSFFPSDDSLAYQYYEQSLCFEKGVYTFTIYDKKGDGLCCAHGNGAYIVSSNGVTLIHGGEFQSMEETLFQLPASFF